MASAVAAGAREAGDRQPSANELDGARFQGEHVVRIATKLAALRLQQTFTSLIISDGGLFESLFIEGAIRGK